MLLLVYYHTLNTLVIVFAGVSCVLSLYAVSCKLPHNHNVPTIVIGVCFDLAVTLQFGITFLLFAWDLTGQKG